MSIATLCIPGIRTKLNHNLPKKWSVYAYNDTRAYMQCCHKFIILNTSLLFLTFLTVPNICVKFKLAYWHKYPMSEFMIYARRLDALARPGFDA